MKERMTTEMISLQSHIVEETIPQFFDSSEHLAATVRTIPTSMAGTVIHGEVQAGGPATTKETMGGPNAGQTVDYAAIQEEGVAHGWEINPILFASAQSILTTARKGSVKQRALAGTLPRALSFEIGGRRVVVRRVFHPPLRPRPFMLAGLQDMESKIIFDLEQTLKEVIAT